MDSSPPFLVPSQLFLLLFLYSCNYATVYMCLNEKSSPNLLDLIVHLLSQASSSVSPNQYAETRISFHKKHFDAVIYDPLMYFINAHRCISSMQIGWKTCIVQQANHTWRHSIINFRNSYMLIFGMNGRGRVPKKMMFINRNRMGKIFSLLVGKQ